MPLARKSRRLYTVPDRPETMNAKPDNAAQSGQEARPTGSPLHPASYDIA